MTVFMQTINFAHILLCLNAKTYLRRIPLRRTLYFQRQTAVRRCRAPYVAYTHGKDTSTTNIWSSMRTSISPFILWVKSLAIGSPSPVEVLLLEASAL